MTAKHFLYDVVVLIVLYGIETVKGNELVMNDVHVLIVLYGIET